LQIECSFAKIGLQALAKNKPFIVTGRMNRVTANFCALLGKVQGRNMWGGLMKGIVPAQL